MAAALALLGLMLLPAGAHANHHLMVISEVHPGTGAFADDAFVELQMYSAGQNVVSGQRLSYYDSTGISTPTSDFALNPPNGQSQRTILVGDSAVANPDLLDTSLDDDIDGPGGAVCFESNAFPSPIDCVAWGAFTNSAGLPVGTPAAAIPSAQSLTRSITPGCATLLEQSDDTGDSATDFTLAAPSPRPNSVAPTEQACTGGGPGDADPPQTKIKKGPKGKIDDDTVKVRFKSDEPGSSFECKLDRKSYKPCSSPRKLKRLDDGRHKFSVRATDAAGNTDPSPATAKFKIVD